MKTSEAIRLLIECYSGRADDMDWRGVVIEPVDRALTSNEPSICISLRSALVSMMTRHVIFAKPHLIKPLCDVLNNLMGQTENDSNNGFSLPFIMISSRFIGIYADNGDELGCRKEAVDVFRNTQIQIEHHNLVAFGIYDINDMTRFAISYIDEMAPTDLQSFFSYGAMHTYLQQMCEVWDDLPRFLFIRELHNNRMPHLPMNIALVSVFNSTFGNERPLIQDHDYLPESPFAQDLLRLSDKFFRLVDGGLHIPKCQFIDLLLVSQTISAISTAYTHSDDSSVRSRYERGVAALIDLTIKQATQKLSVGMSPYVVTGPSKKMIKSNESEPLLQEMIREAQDRPLTGSETIEAAALRFNRQVYLELAYIAPNAYHFGTNNGKAQLMALADLARDGLQEKADFNLLGKPQRLWLTTESNDEKTKMAILKAFPNLHKDTFTHDLGI